MEQTPIQVEVNVNLPVQLLEAIKKVGESIYWGLWWISASIVVYVLLHR
jgi:hypothetical protein